MDINDDSGIRWDKIEEWLDAPGLPPQRSNDLTEKEWEILLFLRRTRTLMHPIDSDEHFPVAPGWETIKAHIAPEFPVRRLYSRRLAYAAAILLPVLLAGAYWWSKSESKKPDSLTPPAAIANMRPGKAVRLILAGGRQVGLDKPQTLKEQDGATIQTDSDMVSYLPVRQQENIGAAHPADNVYYNILEVPRGNRSKLILPDGTKVWINAGSRLTYPTTFIGPARELTMEGEAYFEVHKDPDHPFIVHAKGMDVHVLGTAFDVNTYDPVLLTTLKDGKVQVMGGGSVQLTPGEQARYSTPGNTLYKTQVEPYLFTAWKDGIIYTEDATFASIAGMLGRQYDYNLVFEDRELANLHFNLNLKAPEDLQEVLDAIARMAGGIGFRTVGREIRIFKKEEQQ